VRSALDDIETKLEGMKRQHDEDHSRLESFPAALAKLKADMRLEIKTEFASRDTEMSWLDELRAHVTSDLRTAGKQSEPPLDERPLAQKAAAATPPKSKSLPVRQGSYRFEEASDDVDVMKRLEEASSTQCRRSSVVPPLQAPSQAFPTSPLSADRIRLSSDLSTGEVAGVDRPQPTPQASSRSDASRLSASAEGVGTSGVAGAGDGSPSRALATKLAALAAERGQESQDPRESAVASLYQWFASTSTAAKASDVAVEPRGRPKSKAEAPTRELIRAAAQELVNIKNSDEGSDANGDSFKVTSTRGSVVDIVEEVHSSGTFDGSLAGRPG